MKPHLLLLSLVAATLLHAQTAEPPVRYILRDGSTLSSADVSVSGPNLVQEAGISGGGSFQRRHAIADLVRIETAEPEALAAAATHLAAGRATEALAAIEPVCQRFAAFARVPGSPWPRAALLRLDARLLGQDSAATAAAAREIIQAGLDPAAAGAAKLALARLDARAGREPLALAMIEEILRDAPPSVQARAWLMRGELASARQAWEEALECYLRIPAFYGAEESLLPDALLGSARAYKGYGDPGRAERAALDLLDSHPSSPQAATARREFGL